ncbi:hypothetical protein LTR70_010726 [Exophiala xenobiotica]|uniref:Uncharacterized protein n=1 Tax=Lithohypha guttulata TaxID=1690604 RepID=A0ABR0JT03_9EURO|nr:hypothetical protein LTR24_010708 [Lithohypha guttulata]KAK5308934.1 hypothetical protein LTR70_010726 [Exophiala xenobiotica]
MVQKRKADNDSLFKPLATSCRGPVLAVVVRLESARCTFGRAFAEWQRLISECARLLRELAVAQGAQAEAEEARQAAERARQDSERSRREAVARESQLRDELRKIEVEAEEAIAVEETQILALERHEAKPAAAPVPNTLALSSFTRNACDGLADDFWGPSTSTPWVLEAS